MDKTQNDYDRRLQPVQTGLAGEISELGDDVIVIDKHADAFRKLPANFSGFRLWEM